MLKPKTDIKGFDFVKATTSPESEAFFKGLIDNYIMGDEVDTKSLLQELYNYADRIEKSIRSGDVTYLPITSAKEPSAYKDPASEQSYRGMLTWNILNPDKEIDIPSKPKILKLNIFQEEDLEPIRNTYPFEYDTIKEKIFHDRTGIFVTYKEKKVTKKGMTSMVTEKKDRGCVVLCVPPNQKIPDWCKDFIDYTTTINNILAPFKSVVEILGVANISVGKTVNGLTRKSEKTTNIVRF